jgi:hypothetical protein
MFDATTQAVADTLFVHLKGLDGSLLYHEGNPVGIDIFSPGTIEFAEVADRQTDRQRKRMEANGNKYVIPSREDREADAAEDMAALTAGFVNLSYPPAGDKRGRELYRAFYADRKLGHLRVQAESVVGDWGKAGLQPSEG